MAGSFRRDDIVRALFGAERYKNTGRIRAEKAQSNSSAGTPSLPAPTAEKGFPLLSLPIDIRIAIYDLLLVGRYDPEQNPSWVVRNTCQKKVMLHTGQMAIYRTMEPAILQACKQVYHEAIRILYSSNVFAVSEPEKMIQLIRQIGPTNTTYIRSLDLWVAYTANVKSWWRLLDLLSQKATGLRSSELGFGVGFDVFEPRGLGKNRTLIGKFATIQRLEMLKITGYYAKPWPSYLHETMNVEVTTIPGDYVSVDDEDDSDANQFVDKLNVESALRFREFQEGTEDLVPRDSDGSRWCQLISLWMGRTYFDPE